MHPKLIANLVPECAPLMSVLQLEKITSLVRADHAYSEEKLKRWRR